MAFQMASENSNSMEEGIAAFREVITDCALRSVSIAHVDRLKKIGAKIRGFPWKEIVRL